MAAFLYAWGDVRRVGAGRYLTPGRMYRWCCWFRDVKPLLWMTLHEKQEQMAEATERLIYEHLGEEALLYLLAVDEDQLHDRFGDAGSPLTAEQEAVLSQLVLIDEQMRTWQQPEEQLSHEWSRRLTERPESSELSLGNVARQISGGFLVAAPTGLGALEECLARLTLECFPALIVKEPEGPFGRMGLPVSLKHPLDLSFQDLVMQDAELARLFPNKNGSSGRGGSTFRSSGQGGSHQLWIFGATLIASGWRLARVKSVSPTPEELVESVLEGLLIIRRAMSGDETTIPARVGLTGVLLPDSVDRIDLGWAVIRKVDERDEQFIKVTSLEGQLTTTTAEGKNVVINYSGDLVLELEVPYLVRLVQLDIAADWPNELHVAYLKLEAIIQNVRLGLLLACPDLRPILIPTWQAILDPLTQGTGAGWVDAKHTPGLIPTRLTEAQASEWKIWATNIQVHRIPTIGVAIRRMLASIAERRSPDDVLVDAVIVWENLFGAKTETTLRVSSSLAWLLGNSSADRRMRQTRYKKIYGIRSDVVHGAAAVNPTRLQEFSMEAVQISIDALRALFGTHVALLGIETSEERSLQIMHEG